MQIMLDFGDFYFDDPDEYLSDLDLFQESLSEAMDDDEYELYTELKKGQKDVD